MTKERSVTIPLDYPLQLADRRLDGITMRRPTMGDLIDHPVRDGLDYLGEIRLFATLCGLHEDDLRMMDSEDYLKLQLQYASFRGAKQSENTPGDDAAAR